MLAVQQNALAEKEMTVGDHSVWDNEWFLGYTRTIILQLNRIKPSELKVCNKFLATLSIHSTITSKITDIKSCFEQIIV